MPWPTSQDYFEAVQNPRLNFGETELRQGKPRLSPMGLPIVMSGNFADVYPVECPTNRVYAVKCFTREVPGQRDRYREISAYLQQVKLPFTVEFSYLDGDQGIRIRGQWYPVLKMEWVEGTTLNQFVSENIQKPQTLEALGHLWVQLAQKLRDAHLALREGRVFGGPDGVAGGVGHAQRLQAAAVVNETFDAVYGQRRPLQPGTVNGQAFSRDWSFTTQ